MSCPQDKNILILSYQQDASRIKCNFHGKKRLGKKRCFLEAAWHADGNEFLSNADPPFPNPSKGFLRMSYEILSDTLISVDSFYYDEGFEF